VELGFLQFKPLSISKDNSGFLASAHNTVHLLGRNKQVAPRVCFIQKLIQDGIISAQQCPTAVQIPDMGTKAAVCDEYLSNPLQITFLATGTLPANEFHSALPTPVRVLIYSSCFSWSPWCMCFVILFMCHICCIVPYTSLSSF